MWGGGGEIANQHPGLPGALPPSLDDHMEGSADIVPSLHPKETQWQAQTTGAKAVRQSSVHTS